MNSTPPPYISYLLRLWLAGDKDQPQWRLSLVDPHTGEQKGFDSPEELLEFLKQEIEEETRRLK